MYILCFAYVLRVMIPCIAHVLRVMIYCIAHVLRVMIRCIAYTLRVMVINIHQSFSYVDSIANTLMLILKKCKGPSEVDWVEVKIFSSG